MNSDDFTYYRIMMGTSDSYNTQAGFGIMTGFPNNGDLTFRASAGSGGVDITATGLSDGTWYHVVITQDSSTTTKKIYINGTLEDTDTTSTIANGQGYSLILGGYSIYDNNPYDGTLDKIRIYSSALDQTDVTNLYRENNIPTTNLVTHYTFDNTYTDQVGSNNGTASNTTFVNGVYGGTPTNVNFLGMAFQPDFVWIKNRDSSIANHYLIDSVRGIGSSTYKFISSDLTTAENTTTLSHVNSIDSNGFTVQSLHVRTNKNGDDYVAWCWKAGGAANTYNVLEGGTVTSDSTASGAGITAGSITTGWEVSANRDAGFSIVKWTSDGFSGIRTVGTGLNSSPELILVKNTDISDNWAVYSTTLGNNLFLRLNTTDSQITGTNYWSTSATTFGVRQSSFFNNGDKGIAYCFHSVDGYQKVGSYSGSSSTVTVTTGFEPRFVIIKRYDSGSVADWIMYDQVRSSGTDMDDYLVPNDSIAEQQNSAIDITAIPTGFTVESGNWQGINTSGGEYIYLAIA